MPLNATDAHRGLKIDSPLGEMLVCQTFAGTERMGRLFEYQLDLLSLDLNIKFQDIVGQRVTITLELPEGERDFDGCVTQFRFAGTLGQFARYQATMRPWLWFLTRTADCRIFQKQKVPDIIKSVFRDNGMSDFKDLLRESYREWDYCLQYRETDFNFVSRLMEQEGIYHYFEHVMGKHTLVLADGVNAHEPYPGYATVPYFPPDPNQALREKDHLQSWTVSQSIVPGKYAIKDYDFEKAQVLKAIALLALVLVVSPEAWCAGEREPADETMLMFVGEDLWMVTAASRRPEPAAKAPAVVSVVNHAAIEDHGFKTLAELLTTQPGFYMNPGERGTTPFLRGIPNGILLLYDGVPMNTDVTKNAQVLDEELSPRSVKQVEAVRGPGSVLWGPDAFAGVVNVVPFTGRDRPGVETGVFGGLLLET